MKGAVLVLFNEPNGIIVNVSVAPAVIATQLFLPRFLLTPAEIIRQEKDNVWFCLGRVNRRTECESNDCENQAMDFIVSRIR